MEDYDEFDDTTGEGNDEDPYVIDDGEGDEGGKEAAKLLSDAGSSKSKTNLDDEYADDDDACQVQPLLIYMLDVHRRKAHDRLN